MRLALVVALLLLPGCFRLPVTVHPPHAEDGQPLALPTAPTGEVRNADGTVDRINPAFPVPRPSDHPAPQPFPLDLNLLLTIALTLLGGGGIGGAMVLRGRAKRAEQSEDEVYQDLKRAIPPKENA